MMKGTEVRETLQSRFDPRLVHVIASVAEDVSTLKRDLNELIRLFNALQDIVISITDVQGAMTAQFKSETNKVVDSERV